MTCLEKMTIDNPSLVNAAIQGGAYGCPHHYGYAEKPPYCDDFGIGTDRTHGIECSKCWDRDIPESSAQKVHDFICKKFHIQKAILDKAADSVAAYQEFLKMNMRSEQEMKCIEKKADTGCVGCLHEFPIVNETCRSCSNHDHFVSSGTIKDSGDRTEFSTGAVRDMREGKGRCDLMPLEVVANLINGRGLPEKDGRGKILYNVKTFLEKNDTYYLYLALEHFADRCYDRSITTMFLEVAKHFEDGAKKYGENNWQKGIPVNCYIDSAIRHYLKWLRGDTDEPHDRAFVWNLMCCIWEVDYRDKEESK